MSVHVEVELVCDGVSGFGCPERFVAFTGRKARNEAREAGWLTSAPGGKDFCPDHRHLAKGGRDA